MNKSEKNEKHSIRNNNCCEEEESTVEGQKEMKQVTRSR